MQRGAERSPAWAAVEVLQVMPHTTNCKVKCLYCGEKRTLGASGILVHLKSRACREFARVRPAPVGKPTHAQMIKALEEFRGRSTHKRPSSSSTGSKRKQARLSLRRHLSPDAADDLVMRALVATASPLSLLDNAHFTAMIETIAGGVRPRGSQDSYRAPTRQRASGPLLDRVYEAEEHARRKVVFLDAANTGVTVSIDGKTSDGQNTSLLNVVVQTHRGAILLDVADVSGETKNREFVVNFTTSAIEKELKDIGGIFAVNEVAMDGANRFYLPHLRDAITSLRHATDKDRAAVCMAPVTSTCVPHTLNLLMKDVYKSCFAVRAMVDTAKDIVKFCKSRDKVRAMMRARSILALKVPTDVRFGSYYLMIRRLLRVRKQLQALCVSDAWDTWMATLTKKQDVDKARLVTNTCLDTDDSFWVPLEVLVGVWGAMYKVLRVFDGLGARLYMLYPLYKTRKRST